MDPGISGMHGRVKSGLIGGKVEDVIYKVQEDEEVGKGIDMN